MWKFGEVKDNKFNISQISFEWPLVYKDVVEWQQSPKKSGVFFHEQNICKPLNLYFPIMQ